MRLEAPVELELEITIIATELHGIGRLLVPLQLMSDIQSSPVYNLPNESEILYHLL